MEPVPSGATTVVSRLPTQGLLVIPGRHSQTVGWLTGRLKPAPLPAVIVARPEPGVPETVGDDEEQAAADVTSVSAAAATTRPHLSAPSGLARPDGAATQAMWKRRQRTAS